MLVFGKDGILRKRLLEKSTDGELGRIVLVPLRTYEKYVKHGFLSHMNSYFELEDGVTVADLFFNLEPWADAIEGLACIDFAAFCAECRLPPKPNLDLDHVLVEALLTLEAAPEYDYEEESGLDDIDSILNRSRPKITDRYSWNFRWDPRVLLKKPMINPAGLEYNEVSSSFSPLNEWCHLPVRISDRLTLRDGSDWGHQSGLLSSTEPLLNPNHPMVKKCANSGMEVFSEIEVYPMVFNCLIQGCFWNWGFNYSPEGRDEIAKEIKAVQEELADVMSEKEVEHVMVEGTKMLKSPPSYSDREFEDNRDFEDFLCKQALEEDKDTKIEPPDSLSV